MLRASVSGSIVLIDHMQNHGIVRRVAIVMMSVPIGTFIVNFHMSCPKRVSDANASVQKVRAAIGIVKSGFQNFNGIAVGCLQRSIPYLKSPQIL
jgi:hypothetical protein